MHAYNPLTQSFEMLIHSPEKLIISYSIQLPAVDSFHVLACSRHIQIVGSAQKNSEQKNTAGGQGLVNAWNVTGY